MRVGFGKEGGWDFFIGVLCYVDRWYYVYYFGILNLVVIIKCLFNIIVFCV